MSNERDELRGTLCNTVCNASNYTKRAQPYLLGSDMSNVLDKTADSLLTAGYRKAGKAELAAAWASGYWHGASHDGPLNDAAVDALNPYTDAA